MLFNPTPLEKLSNLVAQLAEKQTSSSGDLQALNDEIVALKLSLKAKEDEIAALNNELLEKDIEIEAIVSKIESLLG
jgi:predicted  nucleic acid-binding Zn-ribbon protein